MKGEESLQNLGNRVKFIRTYYNLSQRAFAEKLGFSSANVVNYWEKGRTFPSPEAFFKMYEVFNVNLNWLIAGEGEPFLEEDLEIPIRVNPSRPADRLKDLIREVERESLHNPDLVHHLLDALKKLQTYLQSRQDLMEELDGEED